MLPNGLSNIGLCFSGGGFRAAGFALGCFAYLDTIILENKPLSRSVKFISSASGGSFANMAIVHSQRQNKSFYEAYARLFNCMDGDALVKNVLAILKDDQIWKTDRPHKDRNPINAFAIAYDQMLFDGQTFGMLWNDHAPDAVDEMCVCATDFTHGQQFRFQHSGKADYSGIFGGFFLKLRAPEGSKAEQAQIREQRLEVIKKIKLGDILAASSCFPAGFEPIVYPDDFSWVEGEEALSLDALSDALEGKDQFVNPRRQRGFTGEHKRYGFMDGGIVDNQAIDAFEKADERLQNRQPGEAYGFDLLAICDVSSNYTDEYQYVRPDKSSWFLKPSMLQYALLDIGLFALGVYGACAGIYPHAGLVLAGATGLPIAIAAYNALSAMVKKWRRRRVEKADKPEKIFTRHIWYFLRLPLYRLVELAESRATSVVNLAVTLFLKKIRQDAYQGYLAGSMGKERIRDITRRAEEKELLSVVDKEGFARFVNNEKSRVVNSVAPTAYLLSTKNSTARENALNGEKWKKMQVKVTHDGRTDLLYNFLQPVKKMICVADKATGMGTTLWFDSDHVKSDVRAALIACGQFTMCYSLLRFAYRFQSDDPHWHQFQADLLDHWQRFQAEPYWLYNAIGSEITEKAKSGGEALLHFEPLAASC
ncbi:hypothetical protein GCM10010967_32210 [Dyadobacter beijingensis]|uniref:PNPLA domain-containing protein n=2 Tax=Dyadobacter beijingensis TaxID=365489 RepID=A0ABQ2I1V6_9BACT|nr:hypothetical protein GCM10010967_32210 [Dyadobacter beijingensis]